MQLEYFLLTAAALFCIGVFGLVTSRNVIRVLMSIELMLNAVNLNLMSFSNYLDSASVRGQVFAVFVISIAAAEAAVGVSDCTFRSTATAIPPSTWNSSTC